MRLLITGSTGFIGQHLIDHLQQSGQHEIVLLLREAYGMGHALPPRLARHRPAVEAVFADLRNLNMTFRAVREAQADVIIHLAAMGATNPFLPVQTALRHNLTGTLNLLDASFQKTDHATQFIIARTPGELTHMNPYATSKAAAWGFCQMYAHTADWPIHGAMIFQAYGLGQPSHTLIPAAIARATASEDFPMSSGTAQKDWIHISDVVDGLQAMIGTKLPPATTVDLGTGTTTSVAEVVKMVYKLVDKGGQPRMGLLADRAGETAVQVADNVQTKALIQWQPKLDLKTGLEKMLPNVSSRL